MHAGRVTGECRFWASNALKPAELWTRVLGLNPLRYADKRLTELNQAPADQGIAADAIDAVDCQAEGANLGMAIVNAKLRSMATGRDFVDLCQGIACHHEAVAHDDAVP